MTRRLIRTEGHGIERKLLGREAFVTMISSQGVVLRVTSRICLLIAVTAIILSFRGGFVSSFGVDRRNALSKASSAVTGGLSISFPVLAEETSKKDAASVSSDAVKSVSQVASAPPSFAAYHITPDASEALNPSLKSINQADLFAALGSSRNGGVVWLGEHHNSVKDHKVQVEVIRKLNGERPKDVPMAIGLEQVQVQFQPALDDYVDGRIDLETMKDLVQWEKRWVWPFDQYRPIFETARELGVRLVALNVDSEDLAVVEKDGFPGLERTQIEKYISDPPGFAAFARPVQFRTYVDYVIRPSYDLHKAMGLLQYTISGQKLEEEMPFRNFFSGRILWDETMAARANAWTFAHPGGLMIGLVGADHVKFSDGIPGRYSRMAGDTRDCTSVILNPTLIDTTPSGSVGTVVNSDSSQYPDKIVLQLRYLKDDVDAMSPERILPSSTGGVLALADYIIVS